MTVATASFASGYQNSACTTKSHPRLPPGWDFAFGPYYPNTMSQDPTAADVSPSMTVNESSSAYAEDVEAHMFGGAVPDFDAPSGWGDAYPVEEDGTVNFADSTFLARIQQTYPGQTIPVDQAETLASLLGRASGRIFYKEQDALSGFFLTEKVFLTCAHLIKPGARDGQERTEEIMRQNNGLVTIGPHRRPWAKSSKNLRAHQLFADNDADYAIFRLDDGQLPRSHDRCLSQNSIQPLQLDQAHAMNDYRLFTIGYNSNIYEKEWDACAARTRELLSSTQRDTLKVMKRGLAEQGSEWRDFISDEMVKVDLDSDFKRTLLPSSFAQDPLLVDEIASDLAKDEDMTNPRPDMTFGLDRDKHPLATETHIPQHILDLLEIVPAIHHVFLIIEGISQSGSSATAENQARRGGATLVKASRTLRAIVERGILTVPVEEVQELAGGDGIQRSISKPAQKHPIRPDYNSFVFSVTICPNVFGIWVHWFDEGNQLYQMNHVDSLAINNSKGPAQVRMALHNIIEFGVWNRREQNEQLVRMIEEYSRAYRENEMQAAEDDVQAAKSAAESGKSTARSTGSPSKKRSAPEESPSSASRS